MKYYHVALAVFVVMVSAHSNISMADEVNFDALDEPRWITTITNELGSTYALVASYLDNAVQLIDVTDPAKPVPVASIRDGVGGFDGLEGPSDIDFIVTPETTYALITSLLDSAIQIVDVGDPSSPTPVTTILYGADGFDGLEGAISLAIVNTQDSIYALVVGFEDNTMGVLNLTDPTNPLPARVGGDGNVVTLLRPTHVDTVTISESTYALVASYYRNYIQIIDVTDPNAPMPVATIQDGEGGFDGLKTVSRIESVVVSGNTYVLASGFGDNSIQVIDMTNPANPLPVGVIVDGEDGFDGLEGASSMSIFTGSDQTYMLVASYTDDAIQVIDITDPLEPVAITTIYDSQHAPATDTSLAHTSHILDMFDVDSIEARVISTVTEAILHYNIDGNVSGSKDAQVVYGPAVFVLSADTGNVVMHEVDTSLEGIFQNTLSEADRPLDIILNDISINGGTWVNHMFPHPDTNIIQQKRSWLYEHDGYIFGSGHYLHDTQVQSMAEGAVERYKSGEAVVFDVISAEGPSIFVHMDDLDGMLHNSVKTHAQIVAELEMYGHTWVSYISQNPDANTLQPTRMWLKVYDEYVFGYGYHLPDSRIQSLVEGAHLLYESNSEAAFDIITPEEAAHTDDLYPLVLNFTTSETVAHGAYPHLLGAVPTTSLHQADRPWPQIQEEMLADGDAWASYVFKNPDTNTIQLKRTYLQLHDGYIFASGYYLPDARVQAEVDLAVAGYRSLGKDSFESVNRGIGLGDDAHYVSILTQTGTIVASGAPLGYVEDVGGLPVGADRSQLLLHTDLVEAGSVWFESLFTNPATGTEQTKRSWVYLYDDLLFTSGYYIPDSEVQSVVDRAVFLYENEGDTAFDMITPKVPASTDALYPLVLNFTTSETVAHGAYPHLVGAIPAGSIHVGEKPWSQIQEELLTDGGTWTSYIFLNPDTGTSQPKRTWLYLHDGYVFASGYYIRDSQVQAIVHNTVLLYQNDPTGTFTAIDAISEGESADTYPFVLNASTYVIEAHGADPSRNGDVGVALTEADRPVEDILAELENNGGTWSHYTFVNPLTGEEENKRSWLYLYDGYIFGSGYYDYAE
ncbi:MAG: hypothetical protein F4Z46_06840 [Cenarchaeum sp. SB0667_bin_13]|nr:hypothetical protein [Cenarchaeum sp. SB0667_bin_13]MYI51244.1 hypothetical protein [Cenarchaeum sp. SB0673_bin_9]